MDCVCTQHLIGLITPDSMIIRFVCPSFRLPAQWCFINNRDPPPFVSKGCVFEPTLRHPSYPRRRETARHHTSKKHHTATRTLARAVHYQVGGARLQNGPHVGSYLSTHGATNGSALMLVRRPVECPGGKRRAPTCSRGGGTRLVRPAPSPDSRPTPSLPPRLIPCTSRPTLSMP